MSIYDNVVEYSGKTDLSVSEIEEVLKAAANRFEFLSYDSEELKVDGKVTGEAFLSVNRSCSRYHGEVSSRVVEENPEGSEIVESFGDIAKVLEI